MHSVFANGAQIPAIGIGTWTLKGDHCADMVAHALSLGYRHVDTAAMYGNETEVGQGIRRAGLDRDALFLTTKIWHTDLAAGDLERSVEQSLKRLGTDHVDLALVHWPNPNVPMEETMRALNAVREAGLTRHIGVSNFTTALIAQALAWSDAPLVVNQIERHPYLDQTKVHAACRAAGMAVTSYCPLFRGGPLFEEPAIRNAAEAHGKSPAQVVLRWHVQQDSIVAIPRTTKAERLAENLDVFGFALTQAEMAAITALGSRHERICDFDFSPQWDAP